MEKPSSSDHLPVVTFVLLLKRRPCLSGTPEVAPRSQTVLRRLELSFTPYLIIEQTTGWVYPRPRPFNPRCSVFGVTGVYSFTACRVPGTDPRPYIWFLSIRVKPHPHVRGRLFTLWKWSWEVWSVRWFEVSRPSLNCHFYSQTRGIQVGPLFVAPYHPF